MSGIAGIVRFDGAPIEPGLVEKMTAAMAHRGPDGIRHWRKGPVALGQCMLCTTPESLEETQPLSNEDESVVLVMDGRLDNWLELRSELQARGAVLRSRSDAELVLKAYETWDKDCLTHIDGDFALAIWDGRRGTAFCARDRMGNKPFNYHWDGKTLTFSSELHAVLAMPWVKRELNEGLLAEYLTIEWFSRDETPWRGVHRLVEAHWMEVGGAGPRPREYWRPDLFSPLIYKSEDEYAEHYRHLFADAVRRASRSDRKLGIEVSGGLDSSAILAVAEDLRRRQELLAPGIAAYTLRFDDESEANEMAYARAVGAHVGVPVREIDPALKPLSWYRDWATTYKEFPSYPNGVLMIGIRESARDDGCRVILNGVGGDEWLWGNRAYYAEELAAGRWRSLYQCFKADQGEVGARSALWWFARHAAMLLPWFAEEALRRTWSLFGSQAIDRKAWLTPKLSRIASQRKANLALSFAGVRFGRAGHRVQYETLYSAYSVIAREMEERIAASLGIEVRLPFWNTAMVQFAFSTPERLRMRGETPKLLHRRAMAGLLPDIVRERKDKADFMVTFRKYADALRTAKSQDMRREQYKWVIESQAADMYNHFGNPAHLGEPEWMLWSLFGWSALSSTLQD